MKKPTPLPLTPTSQPSPKMRPLPMVCPQGQPLVGSIGGFVPDASELRRSNVGRSFRTSHAMTGEPNTDELLIDITTDDGVLAARVAALGHRPFARRWILTRRLNNLGGVWSPFTKHLAQTGIAMASDAESTVFGLGHQRPGQSGEPISSFRPIGHMHSNPVETGDDIAYGMTVDFLSPDVRFDIAVTLACTAAAASGLLDFSDADVLDDLGYNPNQVDSIEGLIAHPGRTLPVFAFRRPTVRTRDIGALHRRISVALRSLGHMAVARRSR